MAVAAKYQPYPAYKSSGVEWLGDIPEGWRLQPCRANVNHHMDKNSDGKSDNYLSLMANVGIILYADKGDVGNKKPDDLSKCKIVRAGDLVINSMNYAIGSYGMSPYDGICSPVYIVLSAKPEKLLNRFALRVFENKPFQKHLAVFGNGILEHRAAIGWDTIKGQYMPVPPLNEQEIILSFLDHETAKIDALIARQQRLIALLEEKRQAVISHAVTKGLDPTAPLRPSGIDWLGDIPAHWEVKRLRTIGTCQNGINIGAEFFGSGSPFISYGDVYRNDVLPMSVKGLVRSTASDRKAYSAKRGDVFFTRTSETVDEIGFASTCLEEVTDATFAGFLIRFRPTECDLVPEFARFYFRMTLLRFFFVKEMNLITRASLSQDLLKRLPVLLPSLEEQAEIAKYLEEKTRLFAKLTANAQSAITLLKERRTALISAAVTGKIDLRGWQAPAGSASSNSTDLTSPDISKNNNLIQEVGA